MARGEGRRLLEPDGPSRADEDGSVRGHRGNFVCAERRVVHLAGMLVRFTDLDVVGSRLRNGGGSA